MPVVRVIMKNIVLFLCFFPVLGFAECASPWKEVPSSYWYINTCRLEVTNGWLLQTTFGSTSTMVFVPDEKHEWTLEANFDTQVDSSN